MIPTTTRAHELAARLQATCTEALIEWGVAVNVAAAEPCPALREALDAHAVLVGARAMEVAVSVAAKLRPVRT